jgi:hypothetical protein
MLSWGLLSFGRISSEYLFLAAAPIDESSVLMDRAVRPSFPMIWPTSFDATDTCRTVALSALIAFTET